MERRQLLLTAGACCSVGLAGCTGESDDPATGDESTQKPADQNTNHDFSVELNDISQTKCGPTCQEITITGTLTNTLETTAESVFLDFELYVTTKSFLIFGGDKKTIYDESQQIGDLEPGESNPVEITFQAGINEGIDAKQADCDFEYDITVSRLRDEETHHGAYQMECNF